MVEDLDMGEEALHILDDMMNSVNQVLTQAKFSYKRQISKNVLDSVSQLFKQADVSNNQTKNFEFKMTN